eukprot:2861622-Amphidinium_carterae.1
METLGCGFQVVIPLIGAVHINEFSREERNAYQYQVFSLSSAADIAAFFILSFIDVEGDGPPVPDKRAKPEAALW